ncbi:hypothetical protein GCM10027515_17160 [Schumannella luteola]|uniref:Murein DD-endopeptidase MepM/ murein hydrolase activator NlpD n=1 Tax=Schumannella luteola TaxID=472059 RepID=A0A852YT60_9MICO|nr:murein DD-endopeptidase MepM/ murein hydrolase activator NlpD [Schumannella luteola]TPX06256.1 M23 family metallopeptidase [Schumannella luteola]
MSQPRRSAHRAAPADRRRGAVAATPVPDVRLSGFLRLRRPLVAMSAALFSLSLIAVHEAPAAADAVVAADPVRQAAARASVAASLPTALQVSSAVDAEATQRDGYGVEQLDQVSWPLDPATKISSYFGPRPAPCAVCSSNHHGIDWVPGMGTPIMAIADGVVSESGTGGELGWHVTVKHTFRSGEVVESVYGHMLAGSMNLKKGDVISRGQILGAVGSTGASTGAHLHFGILVGGKAIEPLAWMRAHVDA